MCNVHVIVTQGGDTKGLVLFGVFRVADSKASNVEQAHPDSSNPPLIETAMLQIPIYYFS
jgi:hypothetical protein